MPLLMANPGIRFINTRDVLPPEAALRKTRFYREAMRMMGFRHAAGMFFWDDPPQVPEAIFSLLREEGRADFQDAELAVLDRLHGHIDAAFRRVRAIENERTIRDELHALVRRTPHGACILDWDLRVADANRAARERCAQWHLDAASAARVKPPPFRLPAPVREACAELKALWRASLQRAPVAAADRRAPRRAAPDASRPARDRLDAPAPVRAVRQPRFSGRIRARRDAVNAAGPRGKTKRPAGCAPRTHRPRARARAPGLRGKEQPGDRHKNGQGAGQREERLARRFQKIARREPRRAHRSRAPVNVAARASARAPCCGKRAAPGAASRRWRDAGVRRCRRSAGGAT